VGKASLGRRAVSFDKEAPRYDAEAETFHHGIADYVVLENLLKELDNDKSLKILDSGGGTGKYSLDYPKELADSYRAVELGLSSRPDCVGTAWSCIVCAVKISDRKF